MNKNYLSLFIATIILFPFLTYSLGSTVLFSESPGWYFPKVFYGLICIASYIIITGILAGYVWQNENNTSKPPRWISWTASLVVLAIVTTMVAKKTVFIFNTSESYQKSYQVKNAELFGLYDQFWKTNKQKYEIAGISKEVLLEVARIQMEPRKDGPAVSWKWVHENTPIDYEQFSKFYSDLSQFVETKRAELQVIQVQCLDIARRNNLLLDTFPNNLYNLVLNRSHIEYTYGILSDSTYEVRRTGVENLK